MQAFQEWSVTTKAASFSLYTQYGYSVALEFGSRAMLSMSLAAGAVMLYMIVFLGSCSPMHCRTSVAFGAIVSMALSGFAGFGLAYFCGYERLSLSFWLRLVLLFIQIEHSFQICSQVDRSSLKKTSQHRIMEFLLHSGPSILISSMATCSTFAFGMLSSLEALRSFCFFALTCNMMLYFGTMTFFVPLIVWNMRRVEKREKDCCGGCTCSENSPLFCRGKLLSEKQREYSAISSSQVEDSGTL